MAKYDAYGTKLYRGTSGAGTLIAQVQSFSGPGLSADTVEVTSHDSTGAWEEVVVSVLRSGELTFDIVYDPANATHKYATGGLLDDLADRTATTYTLVFPDTAATEWTFSAYVVGFEPAMPHEGALTASVSIKITGVPTLV
jgi:predicted secreted protein